MRHTPHYLMSDRAELKRLIHENPWATFVSSTASGLVASHYPVLLDRDADGIVLLSHFGRPDEASHELGKHEILVIIQGPHDYVSASWYGPGEVVSTWNHVTAHLYGVPEILSEEENYRVLEAMTARFEHRHPGGRSLSEDEAGTRRAAKGTVGLRLVVSRLDARAKLSQNKAPDVAANIIRQFDRTNPALAREMLRVRDPDA